MSPEELFTMTEIEDEDMNHGTPVPDQLDTSQRVGTLEMLRIPIRERHQAVEGGARRIHELDAAQTVSGHVRSWARRTPDATAFIDRSGTVTYRELVSRVSAVRAYLEDQGCRPGEVLAVAGQRSVETAAVFLALESMAITYLPVSVTWPRERLASVLSRASTNHMLSYYRDTNLAAPAGVRVLKLPESTALPGCKGADPAAWRDRCEDPEEPRFVYFTSGSTGVPKGALNEHRGMINHLWAKILDLGLGPTDTVALTAPLTFDIAIWQMLAPLLIGGSVAVFDDRDVAFPRTLVKRLGECEASVVELVPTMLEWLTDRTPSISDEDSPHLRCIVSTGEELSPQLAERIMKRYPDAVLVNSYGCTETSGGAVTHHVVRPADLAESRLPVGSAVVNTALYVLVNDSPGQWRAARSGERGELFVGGLPPGCGYLGDHAATSAAFFRDVLDPASRTGRLYRTGDIVTMDDAGLVRYKGRADRQVKINGVRTEPGEIEAAVRRHPAIADCAVVLSADSHTDRSELVAYCVLQSGASLDANALRSFLGATLPSAMVPRHWHALDSLPVTANGKTDYKALAYRSIVKD